MSELINSCCERESLGGGIYRQVINIKPIAYQDGSTLKRIDTDWGDSGIPARPHMVSASRLMVSVADDGDFRVHPTRESNRYFEFGAPLIKVGGNWVRPGFGNRTRAGNRIRWSTDYENAYIVHAGHYLKWGILLKNNWDRWSQFAMPVGLTGLTRQGEQLFADGEPVMRLRAPVVYDYDNDEDVRRIEHRFVRQGDLWYALFTLPDLTGMGKPLIDPTLELQPDAAAGKDTHVRADAADNNYGVENRFLIDGNPLREGLIQFDVSSIPSSAIVETATLSLWVFNDGDTQSIHKSLVEWFEGEKDDAAPGATDGSTYNHRNANTGGQISWTGGAGGAAGTEYETIATASFTGEIAAPKDVPGLKDDVQDWVTTPANNLGWWIIAGGDNAMSISSSDYIEASQRPKLTIEYTLAGGDAPFSRIFAPGFRGVFG